MREREHSSSPWRAWERWLRLGGRELGIGLVALGAIVFALRFVHPIFANQPDEGSASMRAKRRRDDAERRMGEGKGRGRAGYAARDEHRVFVRHDRLRIVTSAVGRSPAGSERGQL